MTELDVERRLTVFGASLRFPGEDELADHVVSRIERRPAIRWRRPLLAAAAVLLVVASAVVAVPSTRHAVARWLGFESLRIEVVDSLPAPVTVPPPPAGLTLEEAAAQVGVRPLVAPGLGEPVAIEAPLGRSILVRYDEVIVQTLPGLLDAGLFGKLGTTDAVVMPLEVDGAPAYWISGAPHVFLYEDDEGVPREVRTAGDTLVLSRGDVIVRIEGDLTLERAVKIARSLREP